MIEQQTMKMSSSISETFINNSNRLKGFPQGIINDTLHLSKGGIRDMWDDFYKVVLPRLKSGKLTDSQFIDTLIHFSKHTDDFIENTLKNVNIASSQAEIQAAMNLWKQQNKTSQAILEALKSIKP
ncbi:hypothetical protein GCM10009122_40440 [Fulvivirga kasyanovii]